MPRARSKGLFKRLQRYQALIVIVCVIWPLPVAQAVAHYTSRPPKLIAVGLYLLEWIPYLAVVTAADIRQGRFTVERYGIRTAYVRTENPGGYWAYVVLECLLIVGSAYGVVRIFLPLVR